MLEGWMTRRGEASQAGSKTARTGENYGGELHGAGIDILGDGTQPVGVLRLRVSVLFLDV